MKLIHTQKTAEVFLEQYEFFTKSGAWKTRNTEALTQLKKNHLLLTKEDDILGGTSISPDLREIPGITDSIYGKAIECLWAAEQGKGYGPEIIQQVINLHPNMPLFGFSPHGGAFEKAGFTCIENIQSETGAKLWAFNLNI